MVKTLTKADQVVLYRAASYVMESLEKGDPNWRQWWEFAGKEYKKGRKRKDKKK